MNLTPANYVTIPLAATVTGLEPKRLGNKGDCWGISPYEY